MRLKSLKISVFITEPLKARLVNLKLKKASARFNSKLALMLLIMRHLYFPENLNEFRIT